MALFDEEDDDTVDPEVSSSATDSGSGALSDIISNIGTTTPEARAIAAGVFSDLYSKRGQMSKDEDAAYGEIKKSALEAKKMLLEAREKLLNKQRSKSQMYLAMAAGFGAPTTTGTFGETLSNVASKLMPVVKDREEGEDKDYATALNYLLKAQGIDAGLAKNDIDLLKARRSSDTSLTREALRTLSKGIQGRGAGAAGILKPQSKYGKQAVDEGYAMGTPAYNKRVNELYQKEMALNEQRSGLDTEELSPEARDQMSAHYGVPLAVTSPWDGLSTKDRQRVMSGEARRIQTEFDKDDASIQEAREGIQSADMFLEANKKLATGPARAWADPRSWFSKEGQVMSAVSADLARKKRIPGEGQISNFDAQQFIKAVASLTKNPETNAELMKAFKAGHQMRLDFAQFKRDYFNVNHHLMGVQDAWRQYAEANPIFDPTQPGKLVLNKKRLGYKDWFNVQRYGDDALPADSPAHSAPAKARGGRVRMADGGQVQEEPSYKDDLMALMRFMGQGATADYSDELSSDTEGERASLSDLAQKYPIGAKVGKTGGAAAVIAAGLGAARPLLKAAAKNNSRVGKAAKVAAALIPENRFARDALTGGIAGTIAETGADQDGDITGLDLISGATTGVLSGMAVGAGTRGAYKGAGRLVDTLRGRSRSPRASNLKILRAMTKDNLSPDEVVRRLEHDLRNGVPSMMGDVGGEHLDALSEVVAGKSVPKATEYSRKVAGRQAASGQRVQDAINQGLRPADYYDTFDKLREQLYTASKPLYNAAYAAHPSIDNDIVNELLSRPEGKKAFKKAFDYARNDGLKISDEQLKDILSKQEEYAPSLQMLDYVKRALDDKISKVESKGANAEGRILRDMRNSLRDTLDSISTGYKEARAQYAGDLEVLDALKLGRENFDTLSPKELQRMVSKMSDAEKDALRTGVAEHLFTKLANAPRRQNAANYVIGTQALTEKLMPLFNTKDDYVRFVTGLEREASNFEKSKGVISNARRGRKIDMLADLDQHPVADAAGFAVDAGSHMLQMPGIYETTGPGGTIARTARWARNRVPIGARTANEIADFMAIDDPQKARGAIDMLKSEAERIKKRDEMAGLLSLISAPAAGVAASPEPWGYNE